MEFKDDHFEALDLTEIIQFAQFLERYDVISLKNEVKNEQGSVLIPPDRYLTDNLIKNLRNRNDLAIGIYFINNNENLKMAIVNRIAREFEKKMDLSDYSFCSFLLHKNPIDLRRILRGSLNNNFFMGFISDLFMNYYDILNHLMEVSLLSIGLLNNIKDNKIDYSDFIKLFQSAMLHDFSIVKNKQWYNEDTFEVENNHDRDSAMAISDKKLAPEVSEIILANNKLQAKYVESKSDKWYNNILELQIAILNLAEYYTYIKRLKQSENEMSLVLYQLSLITEKGVFPRHLLSLFEIHFAQYANIFKYAQKIAQVEKMCIMKTSLAAAYPKPKSTQLLCKNSNVPCSYRIYSQPLKVISEKIIGPNITEIVNSGWYDKCKFSENLPLPPDNL